MPSTTAIIFDLDGVIVDSLGELFSIYLEIADELDFDGTREEFDHLNGPSLPEICAYLVKKHKLSINQGTLLRAYQNKLNNLAKRVSLISNATDTVRLFHGLGYSLGLVSSSPIKYIADILQRFQLSSLFTTIISGDDVSSSKPDPEIYLQAKKTLKANHYYVVEDSLHGVCSAKSAGMNAIHICQNSDLVSPQADHGIQELKELEAVILGQDIPISTLAISRSISLGFKENKVSVIKVSQELESKWKLAKKTNPYLFNGSVMTYLGHRWDKDTLNMQTGKSDYKTQWAKQHQDDMNLSGHNIVPMGVSGLIISDNNNVLLGKRNTNLSVYAGHWETVPAGTLPADSLNYLQQLKNEFEEETGLSLDHITEIHPFAVTRDNDLDVVDINCIVYCEDIDLCRLKAGEYQDFRFINIDNVENDTKNLDAATVPNSLKLLCLYRTMKKNSDGKLYLKDQQDSCA